jgi:hypothetical protein
MANTKVSSAGNLVVRWALPGFAANWKKPTVAEVNAALDITDSVAWSDLGFGAQASNQVSDPSIADTGNVQTRGFAQFGGAISFFYPRAYNNAADANSNTFEALDVPGTLGYILVRADGDVTPDGGRIAVAGDFWDIYKVMTDGWSDVNTGEVGFKYTITFLPQGDLWVNANVNTAVTVTASISGGNSFTVGQKKSGIAYLSGRQVHTDGYPGAFTWVSSDTTKATVDANGVVTGVAAGGSNITATWPATGTVSSTIAVTVA